MTRSIFKMPRIVFIRHAESVWNVSGQVQGSLSHPCITLSEKGVASVQPMLAALPKPQVLITSPLIRCKQTAEAWFGVPFDRIQIPTKVEPAMAEIKAGTYEGLYIKDLKDDPLWRVWMKHPATFPGFPEGEDLHAFSHRILRGAGEICAAYPHPNQTVCVFTHGVVMRVLKCFLANQDISQLWAHKVDNLEQIPLSEEQILKFQHFHQPKEVDIGLR
ncbi:MAG: phosphoglycerate mutase [Legionella sp.]|nr:MAG: phosphoglycerate mutase [Legionella sp.]